MRDSLHWSVGVELVLLTTEHGVMLQTKASEEKNLSAKSLRGFLQYTGDPISTEQLLDSNEVFVSRTVLLETEWVLRSVYKKTSNEIARFFENALMTNNLIIENSIEVNPALEW